LNSSTSRCQTIWHSCFLLIFWKIPDFSADNAPVMLALLPSYLAKLVCFPVATTTLSHHCQDCCRNAHTCSTQAEQLASRSSIFPSLEGPDMHGTRLAHQLLAHHFKSFARIGSDSTAVMICLDMPAWPGNCCKPLIARLQAVILLPLLLLLMVADAGALASTTAGTAAL